MTPQRSASLLTGPWAIHEESFVRMAGIVRSMDLTAIMARESDLPEPKEEPLYEILPDGVGHVMIEGPVTKHQTSFSSMFGGASTVLKRRALRELATNPNVRGILIEFDTPGGTSAGVADLATDIVAASEKKPVYAAISDMCASAGYWLASQCDRVFVNSTGWVGCIGVYTVLEDNTGLQEQEGVKYTLVHTGRFKGLGADGVVTDDLVADTQREIDDLHELFVSAVVKGRAEKMTEAEVRDISDGRVHIGQKAVDLGLADGVATVEQVLAELRDEIRIAQFSPVR